MFTILFTYKTYLERFILTYSGFVDLLLEFCGVICVKTRLDGVIFRNKEVTLVFQPEYRVVLFVKFIRISEDRCGPYTMPQSITQETQLD